MKTLSVLSGMAPRNRTVPHKPTSDGAQIGSGWSPPPHAAMTTAKTALLSIRQFVAGCECVNLTVVLHGNNVGRMPLYEYRCTACEELFARTETMAEHSAHK